MTARPDPFPADPFLDYDAAYVLGALDPPDRRAFEEHLPGCDRCRAAVAELAGMPGLLAQVPAEQVLAPPIAPEPLPDTLLPRLAAAIRAQRRRRRVWTGLAGLAAAACLVTGIVLTVDRPGAAAPPAAGSRTPGPSRSTAAAAGGTVLAMTALTAAPVTATVHLDPVAWGTKVDLECTYQEPPGRPARSYRLVIVPRDGGDVQQVAQWIALPGKTVTLPGSTDLKPAQIRQIRLLNSRGDTLLEVSPPA